MNTISYCFVLIVLPIMSIAQYQTDIGVNFGASNYLGEIGGKDAIGRNSILDMKMEQTKASFGAFHRHRFNEAYGITTSFTFAKIGGSDAISTNPARHDRNLSFENNIYELSTKGEYYFYTIHDVGNHGRYWVNFRPYFFGGVGLFYHSPKAELNGTLYNLRPLKTEGQISEYNSFSVSIPMGMGFYFTYKNRYRLGFEMAYRKTFTDYLDDISNQYAEFDDLPNELSVELSNRNDELENSDSTVDPKNYAPGNKRGDPKNNDSFLTSHVSFSYVLRGTWKNQVICRGPIRPKAKQRIFRYKF